MLDYIKELVKLDFGSFILAVFTIMSAVIAIWQIIGKFFELIGKPLKWYNNRNKDHEELIQLMAELKTHKNNNDVVEKNFNSFMKEMKNEMQKYNNNRINDRKQSFKIQQQLTDSISKMAESAGQNKILIDALLVAQKEMMAEKINEKYKNYIAMDGIPEDEKDEFISLHDAYKGVGGNHHGDEKFNYCINHLKVIPVQTKLMIDTNKYKEEDNK